MKICPKCEYQRKPTDHVPDWQCPSCGVAYIKAEQAKAGIKEVRTRAQPVATMQQGDGGSNLKMIAVGCMLLALIGFAGWKYKHRVHTTPEQASADGFDAAKIDFDELKYEKAFRGFMPLAQAGNAKAQYYVGRMYEISWSEHPFDSNSLAHKADPAKQIEWYTKAAEQGDTQAQLALAEVYQRGFGPNADRAPALHWLQLAADQGDASAEYQMGKYYETGSGNTQDYGQALSWYRKAAEQGNEDGMFALGSLYSWGRGVTKSNAIAYEYMALTEAIDKKKGNSVPSIVMLPPSKETLSRQVTDREREDADQFAANWKVGQALP